MKNTKQKTVEGNQKAREKGSRTLRRSKPKNILSKKSKTKTAATGKGIRKTYLVDRNVCRVTFKLPKIAAPGANSVYVVGDFNDWKVHANPMRKLKSGDYSLTLELQPGKEYQFRYLIDKYQWENDWNADKYVKSPVGENENSVVIV
jgi:1,4-alpha-glucan branching enzyme